MCLSGESKEKKERGEKGFTDVDNLKIGTVYISLMYTASTLHKEIIFRTHHIVLLAPKLPAAKAYARSNAPRQTDTGNGPYCWSFSYSFSSLLINNRKGNVVPLALLLIPNHSVTSF